MNRYEQWKKEIALWKYFTNLSPEKMAPAICLSLTGRACEAALELDVATLNSAQGVDELFAQLDRLKDMKLRTMHMMILSSSNILRK